MSEQERTFVMAKPDAVQRGLLGNIISQLESRGLKLVGAKFIWLDEELATNHYEAHVGKPFFDGLIEFITAGPALAMVWEGVDSTRQVRRIVGETDPLESEPGTIRGDYGLDVGRNLVHASDHEVEGDNEREVDLFFDEDELMDYERIDEAWLYESE